MKVFLRWLGIIIGMIILTQACLPKDKHYKTNKLPLRQLVNGSNTTRSATGWFFIAAGGHSGRETKTDYIKMYALVNGSYKYLEYNMRSVRIAIDNTITTPYIEVYGKCECMGINADEKDDEWKTNRLYYMTKAI